MSRKRKLQISARIRKHQENEVSKGITYLCTPTYDEVVRRVEENYAANRIGIEWEEKRNWLRGVRKAR